MCNPNSVVHPICSRIGLIFAIVVVALFLTWHNAEADEALPSSTPDFPLVIRTHSDQLAKLESDKEAGSLFVSAIGPAIQLGDAARTLGSNPLPAKLMKELLVPDLTVAVHRLMSSLAAWRFASTVRQAVTDRPFAPMNEQLFGSPQAKAWLDRQEKSPWHESLKQLSEVVASPEWAKENQGEPAITLLVSTLEQATHLEMKALQAAYQEWDRIRSWKDQVRGLRGQARLCGTWQWIVHNHQRNHQEQKLTLSFPATEKIQTTLPGLMETVVLGENVYLRWEMAGLVQEDSLQFSKEGHRLEGTFINSQGGWGSVSGKRTVGCTP